MAILVLEDSSVILLERNKILDLVNTEKFIRKTILNYCSVSLISSSKF